MSNCHIKISVIVGVFNGATTLRRCIDSVLSQSYGGVELIIIDGGSTDGTVEIIRSYKDKLAYWESEPDRGLGHAWNKGLQRGSGEWIIFLGADDYLWNQYSIENCIPALLKSESSVDIVYGDVIGVLEDGKDVGLLTSEWNRKKFYSYALYFSHQGIFHRKNCFARHGDFNESFRFSLDYEFLLRCFIGQDPIYLKGVTVSVMQMGGMSNNPKNAVKTLREARKARLPYGMSDSLLYYRALLGAYGKMWLSYFPLIYRFFK